MKHTTMAAAKARGQAPGVCIRVEVFGSPGQPAMAMVRVGPVGASFVRARVRRSRSGQPIGLRFLVDTGAAYTVLPRSMWSRLRLRPHRTVEFDRADGSVISRPVSECWVEIGGRSATSPVVLGEAHDGPLLGAVTLGTLGLMVNPLSRELVPMRLTLAPLPV